MFRPAFPLAFLSIVFVASPVSADEASQPGLPVIKSVEPQPLLAQVRRLQQAMNYLGSPLPEAAETALGKVTAKDGAEPVAAEVQKQLDPLCAAAVVIGKDGDVRVVASPQPLPAYVAELIVRPSASLPPPNHLPPPGIALPSFELSSREHVPMCVS